jgi:hypothetical protein
MHDSFLTTILFSGVQSDVQVLETCGGVVHPGGL